MILPFLKGRNIHFSCHKNLSRSKAPSLTGSFLDSLVISKLLNLAKYPPRITVGLAKPVRHFMPLHRLSNIMDLIVKIGVGLIYQQFFKIDRDDLWIFPPRII